MVADSEWLGRKMLLNRPTSKAEEPKAAALRADPTTAEEQEPTNDGAER